MIIVLGMWATTMIGPGEIGASLFNFIYFAWLGMLGFMALSLQDWQKNKIKFYFGLCLLLLITANVFFELQTSFSYKVMHGIFLAILGGSFSFIYFKQSQALAKTAELTATQVLAIRFHLVILILMFVLPKSSAHYFTLTNLLNLTLLAFFSLILPLYFSQKALEKITSELHAIINSLCPLMTGLLQALFFNDLHAEQIAIYILYAIAIASFYFITKYQKKAVLLK